MQFLSEPSSEIEQQQKLFWNAQNNRVKQSTWFVFVVLFMASASNDEVDESINS